MRIVFLLLTAVFLLGACGCADRKLAFDPGPDDVLTQKEKFALIDYVRGFVLHSRRLSRKLNQAEKDIINRTDPKIRIHYTGPKTGKLNMVWEFFDGRALSALCEGKLQTKNNPTSWQINLTSGSHSGAESALPYGPRKR